jgi:hypothetical protein
MVLCDQKNEKRHIEGMLAVPRFTQKERDVIYSKLRTVGEDLFAKHGLRKATVDDIAEYAGIGKGTFYHFYTNKEHLFMDIFNRSQEEVFSGVEEFLNAGVPGKEKALRIVRHLVHQFDEHPLLSMISPDDYERLQCKVPGECLTLNDKDDLKLFLKAEAAGIVFKYPPEIVMKMVRGIFIAGNAYKGDAKRMDLIDILSQAVVDFIVK